MKVIKPLILVQYETQSTAEGGGAAYQPRCFGPVLHWLHQLAGPPITCCPAIIWPPRVKGNHLQDLVQYVEMFGSQVSVEYRKVIQLPNWSRLVVTWPELLFSWTVSSGHNWTQGFLHSWSKPPEQSPERRRAAFWHSVFVLDCIICVVLFALFAFLEVFVLTRELRNVTDMTDIYV